mmetsp:Transcript_43197/g.41535  ORF Transcript_43197/g.41535 Transcript_43197/m.41535 type:complete len:143 (+) Transcript_43197:569-997(+)
MVPIFLQRMNICHLEEVIHKYLAIGIYALRVHSVHELCVMSLSLTQNHVVILITLLKLFIIVLTQVLDHPMSLHKGISCHLSDSRKVRKQGVCSGNNSKSFLRFSFFFVFFKVSCQLSHHFNSHGPSSNHQDRLCLLHCLLF